MRLKSCTSLPGGPAALQADRQASPKYLIRARNKIYGEEFIKRVDGMGIKQRPTAPRSPWQSLDVRSLPGRTRSDRALLDAHAVDSLDELLSVDLVPVPDQVLWLSLPKRPSARTRAASDSGAINESTASSNQIDVDLRNQTALAGDGHRPQHATGVNHVIVLDERHHPAHYAGDRRDNRRSSARESVEGDFRRER